jgi:hypothetical protein
MPTSTAAAPDYQAILIDLAVESWRLSRTFLHATSKLDAGESVRYSNQLRYFHRQLEERLKLAGLSLINVEGQEYDPGIAASALNAGDFGPQDRLLVDQMVEPIIMGIEGLRRAGVVTLRKASI